MAILNLVLAGVMFVAAIWSWPGSRMLGDNVTGQSRGISLFFALLGLWIGIWGALSLTPRRTASIATPRPDQWTLQSHQGDRWFSLTIGVSCGLVLVGIGASFLTMFRYDFGELVKGILALGLGLAMVGGTTWQWRAASKVRLHLTASGLTYTDRRNRTETWAIMSLRGAGVVSDYWSGNAIRVEMTDGSNQRIRIGSMDFDEADQFLEQMRTQGIPLLAETSPIVWRGRAKRKAA